MEKIKLNESESYTKEEIEANVKVWIEALESGKYKQGQHFLAVDNKFCCLGVACDLTGMEYMDTLQEDEEVEAREYDGLVGVLPEKVRRALGLANSDGFYYGGPAGSFVSASLANHNDDGSSFKEIVEIIRAQPAGLFIEDLGKLNLE